MIHMLNHSWFVLLFHEGKYLDDANLAREFGNSKEMVKSVVHALQRKLNSQDNFANSLKAAQEVGHCHYEYQTSWGKTVIPLQTISI